MSAAHGFVEQGAYPILSKESVGFFIYKSRKDKKEVIEMAKKERKIKKDIIAHRKKCKASGAGLSHYVLLEKESKA